MEGLTRCNGIQLAFKVKPDYYQCGIIDYGFIRAIGQRIVGMQIAINFNVGFEPNILPSGKFLADSSDPVPVILGIELKTVSLAVVESFSLDEKGLGGAGHYQNQTPYENLSPCPGF